MKLGLVEKKQGNADPHLHHFKPNTDPARQPVENERYNKNDEIQWKSKHELEQSVPNVKRISYSIPISN